VLTRIRAGLRPCYRGVADHNFNILIEFYEKMEKPLNRKLPELTS
jgi:hypothetical protein